MFLKELMSLWNFHSHQVILRQKESILFSGKETQLIRFLSQTKTFPKYKFRVVKIFCSTVAPLAASLLTLQAIFFIVFVVFIDGMTQYMKERYVCVCIRVLVITLSFRVICSAMKLPTLVLITLATYGLA